MASAVRLADGTFDASAGIDSGRVTTIQSEAVPYGLLRSQLAWLTNATVRGGGITQRDGFTQLVSVIPGASGLFQGKFLYRPRFANPYQILSIGGVIWKVLMDAPYTITNLSAAFGLFNPPSSTKAFFVQGKQFLVIQAGDLTSPTPTLPLFWDGTTLHRSNGIVGAAPSVGTYLFTESAPWVLPAMGATAVLNLVGNYGGAVGDVGVYTRPSSGVILGTFQVTAIGANTVTLKLIQSPFSPGITVSVGNESFAVGSNVNSPVSEIPAAGLMHYYQGRIWYANSGSVAAGDIVFGPSGTLPYKFADSILKVTENPLAIGGDGFAMPDDSGDITGLADTANSNTPLGQGPLYIGTATKIYQLAVPLTRALWIAANQSNGPIITVAQNKYGWVSDRSIVQVNEDLFYKTLEPAIRSLRVSVRNDKEWGNVPISRAENRVLAFEDRALLSFATGIEFDNRLLESVLPFSTPVGVAHRGLIPLDFDIIPGFGQQQTKAPPAFEGMLQGLNFLQLTEGDFGGLQRAFAATWDDISGNIQIWELTNFQTTDTPIGNQSGNRVTWYLETPAYDFSKIFEMKRLDGGEIWIDSIYGTVDMLVEYRVDADNCWQFWARTSFCSSKNDCEAGTNADPTCSYPTPTLCLGQKFPIGLPKPQQPAKCVSMNARPTTDGVQFQMRITLKGFCRIRGILMFALPIDRPPFLANLACPTVTPS